MGKAHITGGGTDGLYQIEIVRDLKRVQKRIAALDAQIVHLNAALDQQSEMLDIAFAQQLLAKDAADAAWAALDAIPTDDSAARRAALTVVDKAMGEWRAKKVVEEEVRLELSRLRMSRDAAVKERDRLARIPERITAPAWCADFTEDLTGDVGTIEPPDERTGPVIIRPGYQDRAAYVGERDGVLMPVDAQTPAQWLYNLMMLPSAQKWRPQHRVGIIRTLDGDTCSLDLVPANSSADQVDVNAEASLDAVPIAYMDCHGGAFDIGDRVVVAFTLPDIAAPYAAYLEATRTGDAAATQAARAQVLAAVQDPMREPRVIGFESNPRPCGRVFTVEWGNVRVPAVLMYESDHTISVPGPGYVQSRVVGSGSKTVTATRIDGSQYPVTYHYEIDDYLRTDRTGNCSSYPDNMFSHRVARWRRRAWITIGNAREIELYSLAMDMDVSGSTDLQGTRTTTTTVRRLGWVCASGAYGAVEGVSTDTLTTSLIGLSYYATRDTDTSAYYVERAETQHVRYTTANEYSEVLYDPGSPFGYDDWCGGTPGGDSWDGDNSTTPITVVMPFLELTEVNDVGLPCSEPWLNANTGSYSTSTDHRLVGSGSYDITHVVRDSTVDIPLAIDIPMEGHIGNGSYPNAHSFLELGFGSWDTAFPWA